MSDKGSRVDLSEAIEELEILMREDPSSVDQDETKRGADLLALFFDATFSHRKAEVDPIRRLAIGDAIDDLANGAQVLGQGTIGVKYENGEFLPFIQRHSDAGQVNTVYSIRIKKVSAFKAWRKGETVEIPQEVLNSCVYFLVSVLAQMK